MASPQKSTYSRFATNFSAAAIEKVILSIMQKKSECLLCQMDFLFIVAWKRYLKSQPLCITWNFFLKGGSIGLLDGSSMVKIYIQALQSTVTESLQNRTILKWAQHFIFSLTFSHRGFKSIQKRVDLFTYCYRTKYFTLLQLKMVFYQVGKSFHLIFDRDASVLIQWWFNSFLCLVK